MMIKYNQSFESTTLFNCTFNYGAADDCILNAATIPNNAVHGLRIDACQEWNISANNRPDRPLSDGKSVCM